MTDKKESCAIVARNVTREVQSYKDLYEEEKEKNIALEKELDDIKQKLANMSENALKLFNERNNKEEILIGLRNENRELIQEVEKFKKLSEVNSHYKKIAEGFMGLLNVGKEEMMNQYPGQ